MAHRLALLIFALLISWPVAARSAANADRSKQDGAPELTRQENDFRQHIKRRDEQVESRAEVRRIVNFANGAANRVSRFFDTLPSADFADELDRRIQTELARLDRLEAAPAVPADGRRDARRAEVKIARLAPAGEAFSPRMDRGATPPQDSLRSAVAAFESYDHAGMVAELRMSLSELKQNLSQKHLYWAADFEALMRRWGEQLRKASGVAAVDLLRRLPGQDSNGAREQMPAADDEARFPAAKYRDVLVKASDALKGRPSMADVRSAMLSDISGFGDAIKRVGADYDDDMQVVERSVIRSASDIFGSNVNSEIFLWLLVVFAGIFFLIMIGPMLYKRTTIAENLLKAEFLLQFSTVFVLTAAIIILGIGGFIEKDQLPVLLAGISGYVLGQLGKAGADIVRIAPRLDTGAPPPGAGAKD